MIVAIEDFEKIQRSGLNLVIRADDFPVAFDRDRLERSLRDSLIQRFEFCIELFWKYLKRYEEEVLEEVAVRLSVKIPQYYKVMKKYIEELP